MNKMAKKMVALIAALMLTVLAAGAFAETPARRMYDSIFNLLFDTSNVTLTGHAEFSLDGEWFKTADTKYVQDGTNSFWDWKLLSPRWDGSQRESGYTVIANGEKVYVLDRFFPGTYRSGSTAETDTILRRSVQLNLLRDLLRMLADQSEELLGKDAIQAQEDETGLNVHIQVGKDVPEMVNTALNMTLQFIARRYFETDYDHISERFMVSMDNYITVTQAILGSTSYMSLKRADVALKQDAEGRFASAEGSMSVELNTGEDGKRMLDFSFRLAADDYGSSSVERFRPDDYGVTLADWAMDVDSTETPTVDAETEARFLEMAVTRWDLAGYTVEDAMIGSVRTEGGPTIQEADRIYIDFMNEDGTVHWSYFTDALGQMLGLHNQTNHWQNTTDERHTEAYPDQKVVKETEERLLQWLAEENPTLSADVLKLETDWWYEHENELYFHFWEGGKPVEHAWDEVEFIVRVAPEWRIEFFSCIGNG